MQALTTAQIREKYLKFFEEKNMLRMPSSSLIPDDPSLLLTSAGMVQFKPYFLHQKELDSKYIGTTTVQKCVRTNDIDIIGTTGRHLSFFEMLGNFSFGKYFKQEMCAWAYEFSTRHLGLPAEKLYFTVYENDDETIEIWKSLGVDESHISRLGEDDNFWRAGPTGPCGPCSELYFDQGPEVGCKKPDCAPGCDCDRFLEYWNLVFTQYDAQEDGTLAPLPTKNIDTGMGLERIAAILQGVSNNYDTDVLRSLIAVGERLSNKTYKTSAEVDLSLRIMADHSRSVTFMIADGILPSNEGRGYVLRRLLRRAILKAHLIGVQGPFLNEYVDEIVHLMGHVYPEIIENRELTRQVILSEEERFGSTLRQGQAYLEEALEQLKGATLSGEQAFVLHDTYGFPVEVTREICEARNVSVDMAGFEACMEEQRNRARAANASDAQAAWSTYGGIYAQLLKEFGATNFVGYDQLSTTSHLLALIKDGARVDVLKQGEEGEVVLDTTPFYAEMGGEVGDTGILSAKNIEAEVTNTQTPEKGLVVHTVRVTKGELRTTQEKPAGNAPQEKPASSTAEGELSTKEGELSTKEGKLSTKEGKPSTNISLPVQVDAKRRARIARNHTATHILHAALRSVLGSHVKQAGSYVGPDRLRFDFTHFSATTPEQLAEVERIANEYIMAAIPTNIYETTLDEARSSGVTALFGEKYGNVVRVVECGDFSRELCGGCHVKNTSEIGLVKITSESGTGANLRRIEAVTSFGALEYINNIESELKRAASVMRVGLFDVSERAQANVQILKEARADAKKAKNLVSEDGIAELVNKAQASPSGYSFIISEVKDVDSSAMRNMWDVVQARVTGPVAAVFAAKHSGKAVLLAAGNDEAVAAGFNAGEVIKTIAPKVKGGGGGKPAMAQAGGKDANGIVDALQAAREMLL